MFVVGADAWVLLLLLTLAVAMIEIVAATRAIFGESVWTATGTLARYVVLAAVVVLVVWQIAAG
jgi:hypothetical protein